MFKIAGLFIAMVAAAAAIEYPIHGGHLLHAAPAAILKPALVKTYEHEAPAHYEFAYQVHDEHTGDIKSQTESRKGDAVHGQYTLIDADGYHRIVDYTADDHTGFNAVVRREPLGHKVKTLAPVAKLITAPKYALPLHGLGYSH